MGFLDLLPCCGPRKDKGKDLDQGPESATLIPPTRPESIISSDSLANYGATEQQGLTEEQRLRIAAIGRQVGSHMLPVSTSPQHRTSSPHRRLSASSVSSSRPHSPSPHRPATSPPDGKIRPSSSTVGSSSGKGEGEDGEVVRKNLFAGGVPGNGNGGAGKGRKKGKGKKGKGKGKK